MTRRHIMPKFGSIPWFFLLLSINVVVGRTTMAIDHFFTGKSFSPLIWSIAMIIAVLILGRIVAKTRLREKDLQNRG